MRRDKDIISYMYIDTEETIRRKVINDLVSMACEKCRKGYGVIDIEGTHGQKCFPAMRAAFMLQKKYFKAE